MRYSDTAVMRPAKIARQRNSAAEIWNVNTETLKDEELEAKSNPRLRDSRAFINKP
jgi:hypothetical protein